MTLQRTAVVGVVVAVASLLLTTAVWLGTGRTPAPVPARASGAPDHVEVLRAWDRSRAAAWARGDARGLRALYAPGSRSGGRDVAMLRRYTHRELVVEGLETQLLAVEPVRREADRLVLDVTDRVAGAEVVGAGVRRALPIDRATRRRVELRRISGRWLVVEAWSGRR